MRMRGGTDRWAASDPQTGTGRTADAGSVVVGISAITAGTSQTGPGGRPDDEAAPP
jgi:hypothetical protein